jgi:hypothetical protein
MKLMVMMVMMVASGGWWVERRKDGEAEEGQDITLASVPS